MAQYSVSQCMQAAETLIAKAREALRNGSGLVESDTFTNEPGAEAALLRGALDASDAEEDAASVADADSADDAEADDAEAEPAPQEKE